MSSPRPNLQQFRDQAMVTAERERLETVAAESRVRRKRRAHRITLVLITCASLAIGYVSPRKMRLPDPHQPVVAYTESGVHIAYLDDQGEFRSAEDGERLGQVIRWKRP